jgi:hypothetical protein
MPSVGLMAIEDTGSLGIAMVEKIAEHCYGVDEESDSRMTRVGAAAGLELDGTTDDGVLANWLE